jgi:hypothetical protein
VNSTMYIREFYGQTARCLGLSNACKAYESYLGKDVLRNILNFKESEVDERKGAQAVLHYGYSNHKSLVSSLNWSNWLYFHTLHLPVRFAAPGYGGINLASRTMASIKARHSSDLERE